MCAQRQDNVMCADIRFGSTLQWNLKFEKTRISISLHYGRVQIEDVPNRVTMVVLIGSNIAQEKIRNNLCAFFVLVVSAMLLHNMLMLPLC